MNIIDRYTDLERNLEKKDYQYIGIAALFIACKYEEIYYPDIMEFLDSAPGNFTKKQLLKFELDILSKLNYDIFIASSYQFLTCVFLNLYGESDINKLKDKNKDAIKLFYLSNYLLELTLLDYKMLRYDSSVKACASVYIAKKLNYIESAWSQDLKSIFPVIESEVRTCAKELTDLINFINNSKLKYCSKKYSSDKYLNIIKVIDNFRKTS